MTSKMDIWYSLGGGVFFLDYLQVSNHKIVFPQKTSVFLDYFIDFQLVSTKAEPTI